jgi:hypothetical protein
MTRDRASVTRVPSKSVLVNRSRASANGPLTLSGHTAPKAPGFATRPHDAGQQLRRLT